MHLQSISQIEFITPFNGKPARVCLTLVIAFARGRKIKITEKELVTNSTLDLLGLGK